MTASETQLLDAKIIAILRGDYRETALPLVQALFDGGVRAVEVTMNSPGVRDIIAQLVKVFGDDMLVGGGTVLSEEHVEIVANAGGRFVVSPDTYPPVIETALKADLVPLPGALTPTEVISARRAGATCIKLFPASQFGPSYVKQILAPIDDVCLFPTGGIDAENGGRFLAAGATGLGVGSSLVPKQFDASKAACESLSRGTRTFMERVLKLNHTS